MHWRLLERITELEPGKRALGVARTDFPEQLFADHFPSFPVTPGVLLVEMGAQLAGRLVEATGFEQCGHWIYPALIMVENAKFLTFVPPGSVIDIVADLKEMQPETAITKVRLTQGKQRIASLRLVFGFDPRGRLEQGDPRILEAFERAELERLGSPWLPGGMRVLDEE